jgi:hypothetical protein
MIVTLRHTESMILQALMEAMGVTREETVEAIAAGTEEETAEAIVAAIPDAAAEMEGATVEAMAAAAGRTEEAEVAIKALLYFHRGIMHPIPLEHCTSDDSRWLTLRHGVGFGSYPMRNLTAVRPSLTGISRHLSLHMCDPVRHLFLL